MYLFVRAVGYAWLGMRILAKNTAPKCFPHDRLLLHQTQQLFPPIAVFCRTVLCQFSLLSLRRMHISELIHLSDQLCSNQSFPQASEYCPNMSRNGWYYGINVQLQSGFIVCISEGPVIPFGAISVLFCRQLPNLLSLFPALTFLIPFAPVPQFICSLLSATQTPRRETSCLIKRFCWV